MHYQHDELFSLNLENDIDGIITQETNNLSEVVVEQKNLSSTSKTQNISIYLITKNQNFFSIFANLVLKSVPYCYYIPIKKIKLNS
jgi:hypothetical protein